ncbi:Immunoglobulin superfamily containing leucine-rich repeat protein 2 [Larimichthys crocea]|nr:Immunoglobulin superfamily containing leucine-rich repeat protein 2 [Larimichthys crocea]
MAAADILFFTLWVTTAFTAGLGCPELCTCSDKLFHHSADCTFKGLAEIPAGLSHNVTTLLLSANKISSIPLGSFDNVTLLTSLWMAHNEIVSIEQGSLAPLVNLRNFDISYNKIVEFPWGDLQNLRGLQLLKMNHNEMIRLPRDAFSNLKEVKSIRLDNNKFITIAEGTFDGLEYLSHLQIHKNSFACTCSLDWLRNWISTTTIMVEEKKSIICDSPEKLKGKRIVNLPESDCTRTSVTIKTEPQNTTLNEGSTLVLTCESTGNPKPLVIVFNNGTLIITHIREDDSGNYSCSATNEMGRAEELVSVKVADSTPKRQMTTTPTYTETPQTTGETSVTDIVPTFPPTAEIESSEEATRDTLLAIKCGLTANTRYVSNHVANGSLDDIKQYTFDFGVIALGVSETEATVRLNPLLMPRDKSANRATSEEQEVHSNGLYLCVTADRKHSAVQWSRIKEGVNTICLLTVSTVPLVGATCFHLVYKYRSKTYKLILKAKDQYHMERNLAVNYNIHPSHSEFQRKINQMDEEEGETESGDGDKEADTEESVMTESFSLSQSRGNFDNCEVGSEYSDRLPLGAEAVNIISNYKYPNE